MFNPSPPRAWRRRNPKQTTTCIRDASFCRAGGTSRGSPAGSSPRPFTINITSTSVGTSAAVDDELICQLLSGCDRVGRILERCQFNQRCRAGSAGDNARDEQDYSTQQRQHADANNT